MLRHKLWHASQTVWQLNLETLSLHGYPSLPAPPLANGHDRGDRRRDRMRGPRDAPQHAAAPDREGEGPGSQRLGGGRKALPGGAREGGGGGATSLDRRFGGNRRAAARSTLGRERRPDTRRRRRRDAWRRRRREYRRPRIIGHRRLRAAVVVPQARERGRGGRRLARPQDRDPAARERPAPAAGGTGPAE